MHGRDIYHLIECIGPGQVAISLWLNLCYAAVDNEFYASDKLARVGCQE